ncbi:alpha-ketoglutarate-dependent dioxygenase alkB homolog 6 isoform X2 [Periplaneta americana]
MISEKLPEWLSVLAQRIGVLDVFGGKSPNHVLVNEYLPGQGIMPHLDGPLFHPTVTTVTCGSHTVLDFYTPRNTDAALEPCTSLLLERRSLVVLSDDMYTKHLHGIAEREDDSLTGQEANLDRCSVQQGDLHRGTRISLTLRYVPHTTRLRLQLGK